MKYGTAKTIILQSDFPEGELEAVRQYALLEPSIRKKVIKDQENDDEAFLCAAIEIQRYWRGYRGRCNIYDVQEPMLSKVALCSDSISDARRLQETDIEDVEKDASNVSVPVTLPSKQTSKQLRKKTLGLRKLEQRYKQYVKQKREEEAPAETIFKFAGFCAAFIQKWWRKMLKVIRESQTLSEEEVEYEEEEEYEETEGEEEDEEVEVEVEMEVEQDQPDAPKVVEKKVIKVKKPKEKIRVKKTRTVKKTKMVQKQPENVKDVVYAAFQQHVQSLKAEKEKILLTRNEAASKIQKSWRRHIDVQVYKYYRDLINFKTQGDPSMMLRCINPNESKLLDPATGVHVRFRLAGDRFPPNIYYKIFTHRPIIDMCANSPKDYTKGSTKHLMAVDKNTRVRQAQLPNTTDKTGWYQRVENNGWRLVSDRLIHHIMSDPITWETSNKKYEFHHDKLQRKQDVEKRKKRRKIDWMKKMYKEGMLKAKTADQETIRLIEGAAAGMVATVDNIGTDALEEWEVDELLDWTTSLNFDDYWTGWKDLATSAHSEHKIDERARAFTDSDPYEITLSSGASRLYSTRQSQNTPISVMK